MRRFEQKSILVTGGAAGIGLAAAQCFIREGGYVTLVDIDEGALRHAVEIATKPVSVLEPLIR